MLGFPQEMAGYLLQVGSTPACKGSCLGMLGDAGMVPASSWWGGWSWLGWDHRTSAGCGWECDGPVVVAMPRGLTMEELGQIWGWL